MKLHWQNKLDCLCGKGVDKHITCALKGDTMCDACEGIALLYLNIIDSCVIR